MKKLKLISMMTMFVGIALAGSAKADIVFEDHSTLGISSYLADFSNKYIFAANGKVINNKAVDYHDKKTTLEKAIADGDNLLSYLIVEDKSHFAYMAIEGHYDGIRYTGQNLNIVLIDSKDAKKYGVWCSGEPVCAFIR